MKLKSIKIIVILFILFIISGIVYFLWQNPFQEQEEDKEITYETINMVTNMRLGISDYDNIHPYLTQNREILYLDQLIFEPLLTITQDYHITTCLAKEWSKVGEKSYVIKLKENVKWQDGSNYTAEDVKFSIETLQKTTNSIYIENVKEISKVEIVDEYTIRIELNREVPFFEYNLIFPIISSKQYEKQTIEKSTQIPVGTGKYQIAKITKDRIELARNNNYRETNLSNQNMKTIEVFLYDTMGEVYNEFKLGNIDFFHTANNNIEEYIGSMGYGKKVYGNREYDYLAINCQDTILQYQEVRKAISLSINQEKIVASALEEQAIASYFPIDAKSYLLNGINIKQESNTNKAKETLENAGWSYEYGIWQKEIEGRTKTLNITLSVQKSDETRVKVAEEIKNELENVGIKVSIEQISDTKYQNYLINRQYEILLTGVNTSLAPDLSAFLGEENLANYENEEVKQILQELNNITEENLQKEKYQRLVEIYQEEVPYIGLYCNQEMVVYSTKLMGEVQPNNYSIYYNLEEWYRQ